MRLFKSKQPIFMQIKDDSNKNGVSTDFCLMESMTRKAADQFTVFFSLSQSLAFEYITNDFPIFAFLF